MAIPIGNTPVLKGKEVDNFWRKIKEGQKKKKPLVSPPNIDAVREAILASAGGRKK